MPTLSVFNPSDYWRAGHITVPWQPIEKWTGIPAQELGLRDASGRLLPSQIDRVDPDDPARDTLVFSLAEAIKPEREDYSTPSASVSIERVEPASQIEVQPPEPDGQVRVVGLFNRRLHVWFNLLPSTGDPQHRAEYAGSATSVQLDGLEMLDAFAAFYEGWQGHDPEKRCLQLDQVQLLTANGKTSYKPVTLFDHPYKLITQCSGPVRASITIASSPFECESTTPHSAVPQRRQCQLYRVLSLYSGANYLIEELFLKELKEASEPSEIGSATEPLLFEARYFAHMDMGMDPDNVYRFPYITDWFALGSRFEPCAGYGFATDIHTEAPQREDLSKSPNAYRRFRWQTQACQLARVLRLFMRSRFGRARGHPEHFDGRIGHAWYELIFKRITAQLAK